MDQNQNFSEKVAQLLQEKNAFSKCPVCGAEDPAILDGVFARALQGTTAMPCAVVVCKNCGFIREHALDPLGVKVVTNRAKTTSGMV